jgi:hypothetical protein
MTVRRRITSFWAIGLGFTPNYMLLAMVVGPLALVCYYSKAHNIFLSISSGFLGLVACLFRRCGEEVWAEGAGNKGATFSFIL